MLKKTWISEASVLLLGALLEPLGCGAGQGAG